MKEHKLMIGNLLQGKMVVTVSEVRKNNRVSVEGTVSTFIVGECLSFIPITDEWILKFEHSYKSGEWIYLERMRFGFGRIEMAVVGPGYCGCDVWDSDMLNHIKFVHQLQNLYFVLTGEELKIK